MKQFSDEEFEASIVSYERETESFRRALDERTEEQIDRDEYVLAQHAKGKRLKVVLRKAGKKLKYPELAPESPQYADWVAYYENLIRLIISDMRITAYYQNKQKIAEHQQALEEKEQQLRKALANEKPSE